MKPLWSLPDFDQMIHFIKKLEATMYIAKRIPRSLYVGNFFCLKIKRFSVYVNPVFLSGGCSAQSLFRLIAEEDAIVIKLIVFAVNGLFSGHEDAVFAMAAGLVIQCQPPDPHDGIFLPSQSPHIHQPVRRKREGHSRQASIFP